MVNDPISDLLIQIKNGYRAGLKQISLPWSRTKEAVTQVLVTEKFLTAATKIEQQLQIDLKYTGQTPAVADLRRISKPGRRIYSSIKHLPRVWGGLGMSILSTPKGVVSDRQAKKLNVGGEVLAQVW